MVSEEQIKTYQKNTAAVHRQLVDHFNALDNRRQQLEKEHQACVLEQTQTQSRITEAIAALQAFGLTLGEIQPANSGDAQPAEPVRASEVQDEPRSGRRASAQAR